VPILEDEPATKDDQMRTNISIYIYINIYAYIVSYVCIGDFCCCLVLTDPCRVAFDLDVDIMKSHHKLDCHVILYVMT